MKELPKDQENLAESFRSYLRKKNMSENTGDAYGRTIRQLLSIYPETNCQGLFNQIHKKVTKKVPEADFSS